MRASACRSSGSSIPSRKRSRCSGSTALRIAPCAPGAVTHAFVRNPSMQRVPEDTASVPWANARTASVLYELPGDYYHRRLAMNALYGDTVAPADAANAEHFYYAADMAATIP